MNYNSRINFIAAVREVRCIQLSRITYSGALLKNVMCFLFDKNNFIDSANKHEILNVGPVAQSTSIERHVSRHSLDGYCLETLPERRLY